MNHPPHPSSEPCPSNYSLPAKLSLKGIKRTLSLAAFDPRKPGPMTTITQDATQEYLVRRAIEALGTSLQVTGEARKGYLLNAMSIIAVAHG